MADETPTQDPEEEVARKFFPNTAWADRNDEDASHRPPDPEQEMAERLFPSLRPDAPPENPTVPDHIRELRGEDAARRMFSPQHLLKDALPDDTFVNPDGTPNVAAVAEFREIATDLSLGGTEAKALATLLRKTTDPPTDEQRQDWRAQSMKLLTERYGAQARGVLDLAQKLVERDARVSEIITKSGLGNHPQVVLPLVEAALREATKGRL